MQKVKEKKSTHKQKDLSLEVNTAIPLALKFCCVYF